MSDAPDKTPGAGKAGNEKAQEDPAVTADLFVAQEVAGGYAGVSVPFAGLLVDQPELREAELTPAEWRKHLDSYLKSERP